MHLETRLARLEARYAAASTRPIRIVRLIVDPDPAIGARRASPIATTHRP
jgi:hypothetical protein